MYAITIILLLYSCFVSGNSSPNKLQTLDKDELNKILSTMYELIQEEKLGRTQLRKDVQKLTKRIAGLQTAFDDALTRVSNMESEAHYLRKKDKHQVGFSARLSTHTNYITGQAIIFDDVISNDGGGYNPATGVFTAPATGQYYIDVGIFVYGRHSWVTIMKNLSKIGRAYADGHNGGTKYDQASASVVVDLNKGDRVFVKFHSGGGTWTHDLHGHRWCSFSAVLIR